jgi:hypothetical protein
LDRAAISATARRSVGSLIARRRAAPPGIRISAPKLLPILALRSRREISPARFIAIFSRYFNNLKINNTSM